MGRPGPARCGAAVKNSTIDLVPAEVRAAARTHLPLALPQLRALAWLLAGRSFPRTGATMTDLVLTPGDAVTIAIKSSHITGGITTIITGDSRHHQILKDSCWEFDDAPSMPADPPGTYAREYWAGKLQPWRVRLVCSRVP